MSFDIFVRFRTVLRGAFCFVFGDLVNALLKGKAAKRRRRWLDR
jgi:hypothetical protein